MYVFFLFHAIWVSYLFRHKYLVKRPLKCSRGCCAVANGASKIRMYHIVILSIGRKSSKLLENRHLRLQRDELVV